MPDPGLQSLARRLRAAGLPQAHIDRLVAELDDHLDDLKREAKRAGLDADQAERDAATRLGRQDYLVEAAIEMVPADYRVSGESLVNDSQYLRRWCTAICCSALFTTIFLLSLHFAIMH